MPRTFPKDKQDRLNQIWKELLDIQVRLFAPTEFRLLRSLGYLEIMKSPILDLGCGNGIYAETLKEELPNSQIIAVDSNETLLEEFKERIKDKSYNEDFEISKWIAGVDKPTDAISKCQTVIIRLMFQHYVYDPIKLFAELNQSLPNNTLVIIIEEDDSFFQIYPNCKAYWREVELQSEYAKHTEAVRRFEGKKMPYYAGSAGLKVEHSETITHTNINVGTANLMKHFIKTLELVNITLPDVLSENEMISLSNELNEYIEKYGDNCFFLYPNVMTIARTQ